VQTNGSHESGEVDALEQKLRQREENYNQLEIYAARLREEKNALELEVCRIGNSSESPFSLNSDQSTVSGIHFRDDSLQESVTSYGTS
jgi:hypothetical protein